MLIAIIKLAAWASLIFSAFAARGPPAGKSEPRKLTDRPGTGQEGDYHDI